MMSDLIQQMVKEQRDTEEHTSNGDAATQAVLERLTAAEQRVRVTLEHSVNAPMTFELGADELSGRTLTETIETLLQRTDPLTANSIRQTLSDPAALIEVHQGKAIAPPVRMRGLIPSLHRAKCRWGSAAPCAAEAME